MKDFKGLLAILWFLGYPALHLPFEGFGSQAMLAWYGITAIFLIVMIVRTKAWLAVIAAVQKWGFVIIVAIFIAIAAMSLLYVSAGPSNPSAIEGALTTMGQPGKSFPAPGSTNSRTLGINFIRQSFCLLVTEQKSNLCSVPTGGEEHIGEAYEALLRNDSAGFQLHWAKLINLHSKTTVAQANKDAGTIIDRANRLMVVGLDPLIGIWIFRLVAAILSIWLFIPITEGIKTKITGMTIYAALFALIFVTFYIQAEGREAWYTLFTRAMLINFIAPALTASAVGLVMLSREVKASRRVFKISATLGFTLIGTTLSLPVDFMAQWYFIPEAVSNLHGALLLGEGVFAWAIGAAAASGITSIALPYILAVQLAPYETP